MNDNDDEVSGEVLDLVEVDANSKESVVGNDVLLMEVVGDDNGDAEVSFDVDIAGVVAAKPDDENGAVDTLNVDNWKTRLHLKFSPLKKGWPGVHCFMGLY